MALFHFTVTQTKRSKGQSAIASAAYRSGEKLYSEYYGEYSDYTRKRGVICSDILLPPHAPKEYADRQTLWNAVEKAERGKNAQLAYSFEISLQNEFSLEENIALAREFLFREFVSRGMTVDVSFHEKECEDGGTPNPHFHFLCPIRPMEQDGTWGIKQRREYVLDEEGNRIRDANGKYVFNAVPTTDWGSPETLEHWREAWAEMCNAKFAEKGLDVRIDHRSYERQGVDLLPTIHEGATVRAMEKKGIRTEKGEFNRWIKATNAVIKDIRKKISLLFDWITEIKAELAKPQTPDLVSLLNDYYTQRKAGAYSQKGKISNLKEMNETYNYLRANGIYTLEDLESRLQSHRTTVDGLKTTMDSQNARMKAIRSLNDYSATYKSLKPVYDGLQKIKFEKSRAKYKTEHADKLKMFYTTRRKLTEEFPDGKVDMGKLSKEYDTLEQEHETTYAEFKTVREDLQRLWKVKSNIDIGKMKVEEQRKAVRAGYDPDILPPDLITFSKDAAELLADLQSRNERMFLLTFTVVNIAPTRQRLENDIFTVGGIAQKYNCALKRLDWQQEQGFVSSLALGYNEVEVQRGMTTSSTAIFIPFMTRELRMAGPSLYYGMNALSHNVIMADRKKLKSANGLYLGSTGSGKSFAAKRELLNVFLTIPQDRILIVDPMGEYAPLVRRLGGQVIEIAPGSPSHINPMDIRLDIDEDESPLSMKADFLLSLCELVVGGKDGLQPIEKTVIDRCVRLIYRDMALGIGAGKPPLLQDLYEELLKQPEPEARRVATALELYCTGSLNLFNHPTNVDLTARVVCIVLKGLGENLRKIAMHITNDFVTSAVNVNFHNGISTWCYFDEFHILLRDALTASYFVAVWKMLRKKGCVPSALTQNVKDLLASREIEAILDNTDFMILLAQAQSDRAILAKQLGISEHQLSYITHSNSGEGLLFYGDVTIPFVDRFPKGEIYNLLTTRPEDLKNEAKTE